MTVQPMLDHDIPAGEAIALVLEEAGIEFVFCISGGHAGRILNGLAKHQNTIRTLLVREESLAAVMAEVYGRLTGRPGVVIGQGPWVLGNGLIGTIEAYMSSSPMLLLTDFSDTPSMSLHGPYQSGTGDYGSWDARAGFSSVTKQVMEAHDPASAVHATQLAIKHALTGTPGPVAVLFSISALSGNAPGDSRLVLYPTKHYLPKPLPPARVEDVEGAVAALKAAKRPVIVAGNGTRISRAYEPLMRLAEAANVPVVTSPSGKGCFPETHPLALGVFGRNGTPGANACLADADLVLIAGSKLTATDTARAHPSLLNPQRQTFIQIDCEPRNLSWTFPVEHPLLGDVGVVLDQLTEALGAADFGGAARVAGFRAEHGHFDGPDFHSDASPILPQRIIAELQRALPDNGIVTCDAGENRIFMMHCYQTKAAGGFLQASGAGPMGFAIPAALGVKLVYPDRPVVAVCGDGGFAMTMNGLMTALEHNLPIVVVVFNNHALGWSYHSRGSFAAEFDVFDHAEIARGMGCEAIKVTDPADLAPAFAKALASGRPTVIDVETALETSFADMTSPLMKD